MRRPPLAIFLVLGAVVLLLPLAAVFKLPGERGAKELLGLDPTGCDIRGAGDSDWREEPEMPSLRDGPASATIGDHVYLAGGIAEFSDDFDRARSVDTVERFDLRSGEYEEMPPLPRRLNHVHLAAAGGVLFALGGTLDGLRAGEATGESWRFDPGVGRWEEVAPMPTARGEGAVGVLDGRIYVVGGRANRATLDVVESYDPDEDRWRRHRPMPTPRNHLAVAVAGGTLYALGGRQEDEVSLRVLEAYDPGSGRWTQLPPMPGIKAGFAFVPTPRGLVALGGENIAEYTLYGDVFRYRPEQRRWEELEGMEHPRHGFGHAYAGGRLYTFGGSECSAFTPRRESYSTELS